MGFVTPPPLLLLPGDRVAVLAPSSGGAHDAPYVFELGLERLRTILDFDPIVYPTAKQYNEFLSANPRACAADIHPSIQCVLPNTSCGRRRPIATFDASRSVIKPAYRLHNVYDGTCRTP